MLVIPLHTIKWTKLLNSVVMRHASGVNSALGCGISFRKKLGSSGAGPFATQDRYCLATLLWVYAHDAKMMAPPLSNTP
jgi:hypothetical protein